MAIYFVGVLPFIAAVLFYTMVEQSFDKAMPVFGISWLVALSAYGLGRM